MPSAPRSGARPDRPGRQGEARPLPRPWLAGLAAVGLVDSAWLTVLHYSGPGAVFCPQGSGCAQVAASPYSTLLGLPVALLGVAGYGLVLLLALWPRPSPRQRLALHLTAVAGFTFTLYLFYLQQFVIRAFCPYCLLSAAAMTGILGLVVASGAGRGALGAGRLAGLSLLLAGAVVLGAALAPTSLASPPAPGEKDLPTALARHLTATGAVMYGAYWCPHCNDQKEMFGAAFQHISYVECDPKGQGANPALCREKGIRGYPTWELGGRLYEGALPLEVLAQLSGYSP